MTCFIAYIYIAIHFPEHSHENLTLLCLIFDLHSSLDPQQAVGSKAIIQSVGAGAQQRGAAMQAATLSHCSLGHVGNQSSHRTEASSLHSSVTMPCFCSFSVSSPSVEKYPLALVCFTMH